jgi:hypothetical protein
MMRIKICIQQDQNNDHRRLVVSSKILNNLNNLYENNDEIVAKDHCNSDFIAKTTHKLTSFDPK